MLSKGLARISVLFFCKRKFPKSIGLKQYEFIFVHKSVGHLLIHIRFGWPEKTLVMHSWTTGGLSGNWQMKDSLMHRSGIAYWALVMMEPCVFHCAAGWFRPIDMAEAGFQERVRLQSPLRSRLETGTVHSSMFVLPMQIRNPA